MTSGEMKDAKRRALNLMDAWNDVAGVTERGTGYYYELQGIVEDAVECGAQAALGVREPLESEK